MVNVERMDCVSEGEPMLISALKAAKTLGISPRSLWTLTRAGTICMPNLDSVNQRQIHQ
jgi:hypothetical protein